MTILSLYSNWNSYKGKAAYLPWNGSQNFLSVFSIQYYDNLAPCIRFDFQVEILA